MSQALPKNRTALAAGLVLACCHLVWVAVAASGFARGYLDWVLGFHFLRFEYTIETFDSAKAVFLVGFTFICGAVLGWVFTKLWGFFNRA